MDADLLYLFSRGPKGPQPLARLAFTTSVYADGALIPWDTIDVVYGGMTATSDGIVVPITGYYEVSGLVTFSGSASPPYVPPVPLVSANVQIIVNDTATPTLGSTVSGTETSYDMAFIVSDIVFLNASADTVSLYVNNSGSNAA
jgi:hypothetical protein